MTKVIELVRKAETLVRENSPAIMTAFGVTGTLTTAYLAGRGGYRSAQVLSSEDPHMTTREQVELVWRLYIPAAVSGGVTIAAIVGASRVGSRRTAALTAAYSISDKAFTEYREKIVDTFGEGKEKTARAEIAQDSVTSNPPPTKETVIVGTGVVLCCELHTKRYFNSDMETLRKAQNDINIKINAHGNASLSDFYDLLDIPFTSYSWEIGWDSDKLMELEFSTVMSEDGRPCIAFDYNYTKPL